MQSEYASVYGLTDERRKDIQLVFYVGMSADPYVRYGQHLLLRDNNKEKTEAILDMRKDGFMPGLIIFEHNLPRGLATEREWHWIRHFRDLGMPLTNSKTVLPEVDENDSSDWLMSYEVFEIFKPWGSKIMPECVKCFARKRFIRRKRTEDLVTVYHKGDLILYRDRLRKSGLLPQGRKRR